MSKQETMWKCEIGIIGHVDLPQGADFPMREAVAKAYKEITGKDPTFIFSGWGGELTEVQRKIVEERGPGVDQVHFVGFDRGGKA